MIHSASGWKVTEIQNLEYPVAMAYIDLTGDGYNDGQYYLTNILKLDSTT